MPLGSATGQPWRGLQGAGTRSWLGYAVHTVCPRTCTHTLQACRRRHRHGCVDKAFLPSDLSSQGFDGDSSHVTWLTVLRPLESEAHSLPLCSWVARNTSLASFSLTFCVYKTGTMQYPPQRDETELKRGDRCETQPPPLSRRPHPAHGLMWHQACPRP